jgi:thiol-disulfide isomerase/thioredoxin
MAYTESNMLPLGTVAPDFELPDTVSGKMMDIDAVRGAKATVVMFLCNHCPYVKYLNAAIVAIANEYEPVGVSFVGISSNDVENYPQDAPDLMQQLAVEEGYSFPYLYDASQGVARAYDAACTPDFYVFDENLLLQYRGRFDGARPKNDLPITGADLRAALDAILKGAKVAEKQYPSGGCNIKWKK